MFCLLFLIALIDNFSSIEVQQLPKQFKVKENSPIGTLIGTVQTIPSNHVMTLIDDADGRFNLNSIGQLIVSSFIYSCPET